LETARKKAEKGKTDMDKKTSNILKLEIQVKETTMMEVKALEISQDKINKYINTKYLKCFNVCRLL
jgi:hypothetical protein